MGGLWADRLPESGGKPVFANMYDFTKKFLAAFTKF